MLEFKGGPNSDVWTSAASQGDLDAHVTRSGLIPCWRSPVRETSDLKPPSLLSDV